MAATAIARVTRLRRIPLAGLRAQLAVAMTCAGVLAGCGTRGPAVHYVEGVITTAGRPLSGATVCFHSVGGGLPGAGQTDADGRYTLTTPNARPAAGATVGEFTVTVEKYEDWRDDFPPPPPASDAQGFARWNATVSEVVAKRALQEPKLLTPEVYARADTSPLKATVRPGRNTSPDFSFDLEPAKAKPRTP